MGGVSYWEAAPDPRIAEFVERVCFSRDDGAGPVPAVRVVPDGAVDLLFSSARDGACTAHLFGLKTRALLVASAGRCENVALRLRPGAAERLFRVPARSLTDAAPEQLPMGLGKLTYEVLEREVGDWKRFDNRRQVASYTGMCPREDSSAQRRFQGAISKHGNPRVRTGLVEASWRLVQYQPTYQPVAKWLPLLTNPKTTRSKRKQIIVAIGRQFSVDWWRVRTGRCRAQDLGFKLKPKPPVVAPSSRAKSALARSTRKH